MASNSKTIALITCIVLFLSINISMAQSNDCYAGFGSSSVLYVDRDGTQIIQQGLYMSNRPCKVGGFEMRIYTDPFGALEPVGIDTVGSRISGWEYISIDRDRRHGYMHILAMADWPNSVSTPPMDTGTGLLFNIRYRFGCAYMESVQVNVILDSIRVADSTGQVLFDSLFHTNSTIYVGNEITPRARGDANCDGNRIGSDVTYMVTYFRGLAECPCSRCAGDANSDGQIIGSDVTFLVRYFGGLGSPPEPCIQ